MKLFNSLTRKKETFAPLRDRKVTMYVCGITPYDTTHLGHAYTYIFFDILIRYLIFSGYQVLYAQNVTDINDRDNDILKRAKEEKIPWHELASYWTNKFLVDMKALNWVMPTHYLKASENLYSMINLIQKLLRNGLAYEKNGSLYFDISKKKDYGKLSKLTKNEMLKIAKDFDEDVENPDKKSPLDFTLWRKTEKDQPSHIPSFDSPFGAGRPGWHIECSAMSTSTLGNQIDIHGGGVDLIFPHHEAEIAQSEGATRKIPFVKYWIHTASVFYKGEKMSKSLGNLIMVENLLKKYSPNSIRWLLLSHHYRKAWEFKDKEMEKTEKKVDLIVNALNDFRDDSSTAVNPAYVNRFKSIMNDDLNTPLALDLLSELADKPSHQQTLRLLFSILGFKTTV